MNIRQVVVGVVEHAYHFLMKRIQRNLPKQNIVMFESFLGKQYSDSPRAIYEEWRRQNREERLIWSMDRRQLHHLPSDVEYVERLSLKWVYYMGRSKVWISNSRLPNWLPKDPQTTYLQTWHGTPLKKLALDMQEVHMAETDRESYKKSFTKESSKWDFLIAPNEYSSKIFRRAFAFHQDMLEIGYPRNDIFYQAERMKQLEKKVKHRLDIPSDKKVILYAPTWRDQQNEGRGKYRFQIPFDFQEFSSRYGDQYVLLVRFHYLVSEELNLESVHPHVIDVSNYPDIAELYTISDVLITDYSSVMFDYAHLSRPMLFYTYDLEEYRDVIRGFYFDFTKEAPGPLVRKQDELFDAIDRLSDVTFQYKEKYDLFQKRFCEYDRGEASQIIVQTLSERMR